jgi:hypothetical protein
VIELHLIESVNNKRILHVGESSNVLSQSFNVLNLETNLEFSNLMAIVFLSVLISFVSILGVSNKHCVVLSNSTDEVVLSA